MMKISEQLEQREIPICEICLENPMREGCKTCSMECSKIYYNQSEKGKEYQRAYHQSEKYKESQRAYH
ncbi:MAG TPA: hypothetical protein ENI61_06210 [Ignavibacteria bacterium]|nr:hypothetical protein [Ignavibacteria bacterium]